MLNDQRQMTNDQIHRASRLWSSLFGRWSAFFSARWSLLAGLLLLGALAVVLPAIGRAQEQQNQAGLVIQYGDGSVATACVGFSEPEISGLDLFDRAGISYIAQSGGGGSAVCKISGEGCDYPTEDCFCKCKGAECVYWAYQHLRDGRWNYSQIGAGAFRVKPGDVEGWAWGAGGLQSGTQPPILTLEQICAAPVAQEPTAPPPAEPPPTAAPQAAPSPEPPVQPTQPAVPTERPTVASVAAQATLPPTLEPTAPPTAASTAMPPTEAPTEAPTVVPATQAPPTRATSATSVPVATIGPAGVAPTRTPAPAAGVSPATSYLAFGAIVLLLLGGIAAAVLRRRAR
jgi:hypothetical protein